MSPRDQFVKTLIDSFGVLLSVLIRAMFDALFIPFLESLAGLVGLASAA